jgi:hypothetical protein
MGFGLRCTNAGGEFTLSSDAMLYGYLGRAVLQSITQPGTNRVNSLSGFSTYTIDWAADIIVGLAVGPSTTFGTALLGMSRSGNTWTITVYNCSGGFNDLGFQAQAATEVFVWGRPIFASGFGVALRDANRNLTGDLSRRPLAFKHRVSLNSVDDVVTLSAMSKPVVIGLPLIARQQSTFLSPRWVNRIYIGSWLWNASAAQLARAPAPRNYSEDDGGIANNTSRSPANALVLDGVLLP